MPAANTDIAVASNALVLIGSAAIASFSDTDTGAVVANEIFDDVAEGLLSEYPWTFARKQGDAMSRLAAVPDQIWDAAYQLPTDVLTLRTVTVQDSPIDYDVYGDQVFCNVESSESVYPIYTYYAPVNVWHPLFRLFVELTLAGMFATSVAMKPDIATLFEGKAEIAGRKARNMDGQSVTSNKVKTSRFISNRR